MQLTDVHSPPDLNETVRDDLGRLRAAIDGRASDHNSDFLTAFQVGIDIAAEHWGSAV
jgi:hypothetical protein